MQCRSLRGLVGLLIAALLLALLPLGTVSAQAPPPGASLPPPANVGKLKDPKLESTLARIAQQVGTRPARELAAQAPLSRGETVEVTVRLANAGALPALRTYVTAHGATIANTGPNLIEAYVPVTELAGVATQPGVLTLEPIVPPVPTLTVSQGTTVHNSTYWNAAGFNGSGVKIGIIDAGFIGITGLIAAGELPTPAGQECYSGVGTFVTALPGCETGTVHGAAVAETVIDVAPAATLYVADPVSATDTRNVVAWMVSQGVQVINYSIGWTNYWGPGNGTSPFTNSPFDGVNDAVAGGILFVNSAGNDGNGSWIGPYSGSVGSYIRYSGIYDANYFYLTAGNTYSIRARWEDSWSAAGRDIDLYLLKWNGTSYTTVASSVNDQSGLAGETPRELIQYTPSTSGYYAAGLYHYAGSAPAWLQMQVLNGPSIYFQNKASSIGIPAESANPGMVAVGATPYSSTASIESYSSQGPTIDNRTKPDVVGADCATTISYPTGFCGTSQASPHVAGLAALVRQRYPTYTPVQVANYLRTNTLTRGSPIPNNVWGSGLAVAAMSVTGVGPASGSTSGGTKIQISGVGIGATTTVTVGGAACAPVASMTGATISCTTGAGTAGAATVTLATNGQTLVVPGGYTYGVVNPLPPPLPTGPPGGPEPNPLPGTRAGGTTGGPAPSPLPPSRP